MNLRNPSEVNAEIERLSEIKPKVRRQSYFGDDHHDAIDAQIEVLSDGLDSDDIFDREESGDWRENVRSAAEDALRWKEGEELEDGPTPSKTWESLFMEKSDAKS